jgi:hypothetical protein
MISSLDARRVSASRDLPFGHRTHFAIRTDGDEGGGRIPELCGLPWPINIPSLQAFSARFQKWV